MTGRVIRRARTALFLGQFARLWRISLMVPASRGFGFERGTPVDRHYVEDFLTRHADDIRGRVLEVGDDRYTRELGRGVESVAILDVDPDNARATVVGDLSDPATLPQDEYDCIVCTQVLMLIYDLGPAIANLHRALRPGGVLLVTVAGITRVCPDIHRGGDFWRFTSASLRRMLEDAFGPGAVAVSSYGNVRSASANLYGLAADELKRAELDLHDPDFEVTVGARAVRTAR